METICVNDIRSVFLLTDSHGRQVRICSTADASWSCDVERTGGVRGATRGRLGAPVSTEFQREREADLHQNHWCADLLGDNQ